MIKVNLLKNKVGQAGAGRSEISSEPSGDVSAARNRQVFNLLLVLSGVLCVFGYQKFNLGQIRDQQAAAAMNLAMLTELLNTQKGLADNAQNLKAKAETFKQKLNFSLDIAKNRLVVIKSMDYLQSIIPEKVWIKILRVEVGPPYKAELDGLAITNDDLNLFETELKKYFKEVLFGKRESNASGKDQAIDFTMELN